MSARGAFIAFIAFLGGAILLASGALSHAATITIVNNDGTNEGFNDRTPADPVGGNVGTTIGEQRLIAFQYAADIWGSLLPSDVVIEVRAAFNPLSCEATSGVLGSAGPVQVFSDFPNAPRAATWYPIALANKLAGSDLAPSNPDINAQFNSSIDNNDACLQNTNWYYGLDGNSGGDIDLIVVLLHEMGHGLGFVSLVDEFTGSLFSGLIDIYSAYLFDNTLDLFWSEMSNGQRASSAVNSGNVAFAGPVASAQTASFLSPAPALVIESPSPPLEPNYVVGTASFGGSIPSGGLSAEIALAEDGSGTSTDACQPIINGTQIAGRIALIDRGSCTFASKAEAAQAAGAVAAIIVNNVPGGGALGLGGSSATVTIPVVSLSLEDGSAIKAALLDGPVSATLGFPPGQLAGADPDGRPLVYTPNPVRPGSSVSHFDIAAFPNLLMEPAINSDLGQGVDLTLALFEDLGWLIGAGTPAPPALLPSEAALHPNVPNPFNPSTQIRFELPHTQDISLDVYDLRGRRVRRLAQGAWDAGEHSVIWDGTDEDGRTVSSGVYVSRLRTADGDLSRRLVLLK